MSQSRSDRRPTPLPGSKPGLKTADCPAVAELIDFGEGRMSAEDRRRIEAHLASTNCAQCRGWIEKATANPSAAGPFRSTAAPRSERLGGDEAAWQRQAFLDLEERLRRLEEEG